jgi:hypothetical protein
MKEAWIRVDAACGVAMRLTRRVLKAHLLAKELVGAARIIAPNESERRLIFEPAFWEPVELDRAWSVSGYEQSKGEEWFFFVRRRELDRLYPAAREQPTTPEPSPPRRKPGRKITAGWRLFAAHAAYEFKKKHGQLPTRSKLAQLCENELKYQPDVSDIGKLLRYLLGE